MIAVTTFPSPDSISPRYGQLTVREFALQSIQKYFDKSIKHEAEVFADRDPEPLHQMRVGMRRLRTALTVFDPFVALPSDLERNITKISKALGTVRDLDVMGIWLRDYLRDTTLNAAESNQLVGILKRLDRRRQKQFQQMSKMLEGQRYRQFVEELQQWLNHPAFVLGAEWPIGLVLPDLLLPLLNRLLLHPGWLVAIAGAIDCWKPNVDINSDQVNTLLTEHGLKLHDLRKQTKRVRYQTEFFIDFYDETYREQTLEFRMIQDLLGQLQDSQVLSNFLAQEMGHQWPEHLPALHCYFQQQCLDRWRRWQPIQQKYLKAEFRERLRALLAQPHYA